MKTDRELAALLKGLHYPWERFTIDHFIAYIGRVKRKRRINVVGIDDLPLPWCASGPTMDYIFYSVSLSPILQNHHKLHEIGHLVLNHVQRIKFLASDNIVELVGSFNPRFRSATLMTNPTVMDEENEAERFVYLVHDRLHTHRRLHELTSISHRKDLFMPPFSGTFSKSED